MNNPNPTPLAPDSATWRLDYGIVTLTADGLAVTLNQTIEEAEIRELLTLIGRINALADQGVMGLPHPMSEDEAKSMRRSQYAQWATERAQRAVAAALEDVIL